MPQVFHSFATDIRSCCYLVANASRDDQALAIACSYLFRSLGSVFGISLSATVANTVLRSQLERRLPSNGDGDAGQAREIGRRIRESLAYIRTLEPQVQAIVRTCYAGATHAAFGLQAIIAVGAAVAAWFIVEKKLSR